MRSLIIGCVVLGVAAGCSSGPQPATPTGVPSAWYDAVGEALDDRPDVGAVALVDSGGPCPLRGSIEVDGRSVDKVLGHGVERLDGTVPAVVCQWYEGTPVEVTVARADDDAGYRLLVDSATAVQQAGNVQTDTDVTIGERTVRVVRTVYPTNPSAGTDFEAFFLDKPSRGRVGLRVSNSDERSTGYDETATAADLVRFIDG